ncbi:hypothetical protein Y032_0042g691 [Ancylostoma ceylanicum]|nr:hypothetical protein Y032_0042g691 [Ancylostoma ceylanicum]
MCGLLGAPESETLSSVVPKETSKQVVIYRHMRTLRRYENDKVVVKTLLPSYIGLNLGFHAVALVQVIAPRANNLFLTSCTGGKYIQPLEPYFFIMKGLSLDVRLMV